MLKKTLPPGIAEPDKDEPQNVVQTHKGPLPVEQVPQALAMMDQQIQALTAQGPEIQKQAQQVKDEATKVEAAKMALENKAAQVDAAEKQLQAKLDEIAAAERELALHKQLADEQLKNERLEAEGILRDQQAEMTAKAAEGAENEPAKPQAQQQPVQVIDSSFGKPIEALAQAIAQGMANPPKRRTTLINDANGIPIAAETETVNG
jgi:chromosome segregation ATPase